MHEVKICWLNHGKGLTLRYQSEQAAGFDLVAAIDEEQSICIGPGQRTLIDTGFCMALPRQYEAQIRPRSGLALKHGITVLNAPGTIDADYRGEIKVLLINMGDEDFHVNRGMRIAQMVIAPVIRGDLMEVLILDDSSRAKGGFGSTG